jgi:hypothetical protein
MKVVERLTRSRRAFRSEKTGYDSDDEGGRHADGGDVELGCPVKIGCQIHRRPLPHERLFPL